ncbi:hypothetical protein KDN34_11000 [Shewanella yunxiaonensis]|uniref:Uncharacterized protein n=1 Tax=Shewanella yunxiaonensis TaxID=2829809 RepID=A0ABX7YRH2_9GAMM|nr:hypothetical protein [Shewanella yunxiaonensis]QUN04776.1 hypothetical protein KDN34_11000 [Shewanella yunxiaonensis]
MNRLLLRKTNILPDDRQTLHKYGFSDPEIDRLRAWVMSNPWEINEVNEARQKIDEIKTHIAEIKEKLAEITATTPSLTLELNHLCKQFHESPRPSITEGFPFLEAEQQPNAIDAQHQLEDEFAMLEQCIDSYLTNCDSATLLSFHNITMEIKETTGKERLITGLRNIWSQKHPEDTAITGNKFLNFLAILFMSSDNKHAKAASPDAVKQWCINLRKSDFKSGKRLCFPLNIYIEEDGTETYLDSPPTIPE